MTYRTPKGNKKLSSFLFIIQLLLEARNNKTEWNY